MRGPVVAVMLAALLAAGCTATDPARDAPPAGPTAPSSGVADLAPGASASSDATPANVSLDKAGDMTQPGQLDLAWSVEPGFVAIEVQAVRTSVGAPATMYAQVNALLEGGDDGDGSPSVTQSYDAGVVLHGQPSQCLLCFDGRNATAPGSLVGPWRLHLDWGAANAEWTVRVRVTY